MHRPVRGGVVSPVICCHLICLVSVKENGCKEPLAAHICLMVFSVFENVLCHAMGLFVSLGVARCGRVWWRLGCDAVAQVA